MSQWRDDTRTRLRALGRPCDSLGPSVTPSCCSSRLPSRRSSRGSSPCGCCTAPCPFYAPMAALLVVDRTMVRSLSASAQRIAAVVLGLGVAWVASTFVGVTWWTMFVVILVGARHRAVVAAR